VLKHLGIPASLGNVGQVYPRGLDFEVVSALHQVGAAAASFATTMRLMAGAGLLTEGFQEGQVGSSAMPHKANARNCERICGFSTILGGYVTMTATLAGDQWNEGDVSCSVVRRVALPDAFFAIDGSLETLLTVLEQMEAFPSAIAQENERNLPFLATTTILMESVKRGAGRETAHEAIKEHSLAAMKAMRSGPEGPDLLDRLAGDKQDRPGQEGPPGHPRRKRAVRGLGPEPGRRVRRRGEAARQAGEGRGRVPAVEAPLACSRGPRSFQLRTPGDALSWTLTVPSIPYNFSHG
jgi:adenylosuccinate lyase